MSTATATAALALPATPSSLRGIGFGVPRWGLGERFVHKQAKRLRREKLEHKKSSSKTQPQKQSSAQSPYKHLPAEGRDGRWAGSPGDSVWQSTHPAVLSITQGKGITFADGYPNFAPWALATAHFSPGTLQGKSQDGKRADLNFASSLEVDAERVRKLRQLRGLVWHHVEDGVTMQLLPISLHANIPHAGGATLLRRGLHATTSTCLLP